MTIKTGNNDDDWNILAGKRIPLDRSFPALKPCRFCAHETGVLTGPKGPHTDGVRCEKCYRHLGWLPPAFGCADLRDDFDVIEG